MNEEILNKNQKQEIDQQDHLESHINYGQYLKSFVYGGLDGTINTLAVIVGGIASGTQPFFVLTIGISILIGDGISMGLGDYLSSRASEDYIQQQRNRQEWQFQHLKQVQKKQVRDIYLKKGYSQAQARRLVQLLSTNSEAFVDVMMLQQLGLVSSNKNPIYNGIITFASFAIMGLFPLIPYIIEASIKKDNKTHHLIACIIIAVILLFIFGLAKAALAQLNILKSAIETLVFGILAVGAGYGVGLLFHT